MTSSTAELPLPNREQLATLYEITRSLNSTLDLDEVLENIMDRVIEVTGAERGFLMLCEPGKDEMLFKVARGLDRSDLETPAFQVSTTIVHEVERTRKPLLTDNAQFDPRFQRGESIMVLGLRSILCVPILVKDRLLGLVYVDNRLQAGLFNREHLALLTAFAGQAGTAIENARLYQVAVEKGRMEKELQMAHDIQRGLLPNTLPTLPGYEIAADWHSAREVAGDFYDCFELDENRLGLVIADVSDKGAPAAIFMAVARSLIRGNALSASSPEETLRQTNSLILHDTQSGMFVTVYYAIVQPGGAITGVNAGHNRPLHFHAAQDTHEFLPRGGHPLGWFAELPVQAVSIQLEPGDVLIFYTDGLTEAENIYGEPYGDERLVEVVRAAAQLPAADILKHILSSVSAFMGAAPPFDDTTLVVLRYTGTAGSA
ncbi:MAG: SpoIIE family protein phosphatase [Chloroflexi bacterium]|jgi:serine phosphatase RsbU (regulator of sigma subunit)|nr:SpoIIE family protein phosphatase [Chloroflexota bacterium]